MTERRRIAVLGLYNSGSTALAGALHRLGANMGSPFWRVTDDDSPDNNYEPYDLSFHLRRWWNEPELQAASSAKQRRDMLGAWIRLQEARGYPVSGAKHPLLAMCAEDLFQAWGHQTSFIWTRRPLESSAQALGRRGWFGPDPSGLQHGLWQALENFCESRSALLLQVDFADLMTQPKEQIQEVIRFLDLEVDSNQLMDAAEFILNPPQKPGNIRDKVHAKLRTRRAAGAIAKRSRAT